MNIISLCQINNTIFLKNNKFELVILFKTDIKYTIFKNKVNYANDTFMIRFCLVCLSETQ